MPIKDKSKYPANWISEIRPAILERAGNCCEICNVPNKELICRGSISGIEVWQNDNGECFNLTDGQYLTSTYWGDISKKQAKLVRIILTVAHLDHDTNNNDYSNLKALCQLHHLRHDVEFHKKNSTETRIKKKQLQTLF